MKKIFTLLFCCLLFGSTFGQSYQTILKKINSFLSTFDNGYYGYLSIDNGVLIDHYKSGSTSSMLVSDIYDASVVEAKRKVEISCNKNSYSCVTGYNGGAYGSMPFSTSTDFNASGFADDLNELIAAYRKGGSKSSSTAEFSVGTRVRVIESKDGNSDISGIIDGGDLRSLRDGWFTGNVKTYDGTIIKYKRARFQVVK